MKFARELQETLINGEFPTHWVKSAVPYGLLKKIIKKVRQELEEYGLDLDELANETAVFQYAFESGGEDKVFRPKLTLYYDGENNRIVDATLSAGTRNRLRAMVANRKGDFESDAVASERSTDETDCVRAGSNSSVEDLAARQTRHRYDIRMTCDAEFFGLLQEEVSALDIIQLSEQKILTKQVTSLSRDMTHLTLPSKLAKTDMYRWREIFDIYLQAQIFFSTRELDHGRRSRAAAADQLGWFQSEVTKRGLLEAFKLPASIRAFNQFVLVNVNLLRNLTYLEINQKAMGKILKKFDKRTHLHAIDAYPNSLQPSALSEIMAKAVCTQVALNIVGITPQMDDGEYTCPICSAIAWRPIRLACQHVLCSKCIVHLQRTYKYNCPMCREKGVVKEATEENIDQELIKKLKKYFPKETREKRIQLETEDGIALFGPTYKHPSEQMCRIM